MQRVHHDLTSCQGKSHLSTISCAESNVAEPLHVGSTFGLLSLMGCLPTNLATHSSGRLHMFPVTLLSKTEGPINLLPSKPHHTFTENLLWNLVTTVSCGLSWDHVCIFHELCIPSQVKDTSSVNKITLNSWGCAVIQWHKSIH